MWQLSSVICGTIQQAIKCHLELLKGRLSVWLTIGSGQLELSGEVKDLGQVGSTD